jgi:Phytanoyl-CoA dioxygenase (PhyH)
MHAVRRPAFSAEDFQSARADFAENGYVIFRDVVSRERLAHVRTRMLDELERAKLSGRLFSGGGNISGHLNSSPGEEARFAYDTLAQHGIIDFIRGIFPKAVRPPNVGCNLNLPNSVPQHYHPDWPFTKEFVIANVAVVDTDVTNGAIDVLPGTHKRFYKFWRYALERTYRLTTRVPLKQGDVLVRSSNLWHRGMPNHTAVPRPMLAFTWEDGGSTYDDPFQIDDGKITFRENWYRSDWRGQLRERIFVSAPITYSAYRFVRSLYGNRGYDSY